MYGKTVTKRNTSSTLQKKNLNTHNREPSTRILFFIVGKEIILKRIIHNSTGHFYYETTKLIKTVQIK